MFTDAYAAGLDQNVGAALPSTELTGFRPGCNLVMMAKSAGRALMIGGVLLCAAPTLASAEDRLPTPDLATISFDDPIAALDQAAPLGGSLVDAEIGAVNGPRFSPATIHSGLESSARRFEVELAAPGARTGIGFDVAIAQRASFGADSEGDLNRAGNASEVRFGQGLGLRRAPSQRPTWFLFAASEDEAVTWQPGARTAFGGAGGSFALQDRVEIGDMQAGVTYERGPVQASLAYVEREVSTQIGVQSWSEDERFAGVTLTMKR